MVEKREGVKIYRRFDRVQASLSAVALNNFTDTGVQFHIFIDQLVLPESNRKKILISQPEIHSHLPAFLFENCPEFVADFLS